MIKQDTYYVMSAFQIATATTTTIYDPTDLA